MVHMTILGFSSSIIIHFFLTPFTEKQSQIPLFPKQMTALRASALALGPTTSEAGTVKIKSCLCFALPN